jgi:hypothetical protein
MIYKSRCQQEHLSLKTFHNPCKNKKGRSEICSDPSLNTEKQKAPSIG